jgi:hypothetical protein
LPRLQKQAEEEGVEPLKVWFADLANDIIAREFDDSVEFARVEQEEVDQVKQAEILNSYAANGVLTLNQVRERIGARRRPCR